jgi:flagellar biosynthesis/type III secretory pathway chaperone
LIVRYCTPNTAVMRTETSSSINTIRQKRWNQKCKLIMMKRSINIQHSIWILFTLQNRVNSVNSVMQQRVEQILPGHNGLVSRKKKFCVMINIFTMRKSNQTRQCERLAE